MLNAGVELPPLPERCKRQVPHASLATGSEAVVVLKRERAQLDVANATIALCARNYETVQQEFQRPARKSNGPLPEAISR